MKLVRRKNLYPYLVSWIIYGECISVKPFLQKMNINSMAVQEKEAKYEYSIENDDYHMYNEGV